MPIEEWAEPEELPGEEVARKPRGPRKFKPPALRYDYTGGDIIVLDPWKLRMRRYRAVLTREELAQRIRVSVMSVAAYERGARRPRLPVFRRLFVALGCGPEDLLPDGHRYGRPGLHGLRYDDGRDVTLSDNE